MKIAPAYALGKLKYETAGSVSQYLRTKPAVVDTSRLAPQRRALAVSRDTPGTTLAEHRLGVVVGRAVPSGPLPIVPVVDWEAFGLLLLDLRSSLNLCLLQQKLLLRRALRGTNPRSSPVRMNDYAVRRSRPDDGHFRALPLHPCSASCGQ